MNYIRDVSQEGDGRRQPNLRPWPPPQGGYERILRPDRRAASRRPLTGSQIIFLRVLFLLAAAFVVATRAAGQPAPSLWHAAAIGVAAGLAGVLVGWLFVPFGRHWLLQLAGLRPASARDS
jgi:hypothetical protein